MTEDTMNHLIAWAINHRNDPMDVVKAICDYMARLDKEDVEYMINRYGWDEIEGIVNR